jgi:type II secretory pathway pseudopilin PulG
MDLELRRARKRRRASGMSLVELAIAAGILLVVAMSIIPLFTASMVNNATGRQLSQATNHARSASEEIRQLPLDRVEFEIQDGQSSAVRTRTWAIHRGDPVASGRWTTGTLASDERATWARTATLRQFNVSRILPNPVGTTDPIPGGFPDEFVHLRETVVEVVEVKEPLDPRTPKSAELTTVRSF